MNFKSSSSFNLWLLPLLVWAQGLVPLNAQAQADQESSFFGWAKSGLSIRNAPKLEAEKIGVIPYREELKLLEVTREQLSITEFPGFDFTGNWVKVKYKEIQGFVFSGYISKHTPPLIKEGYDLEDYLKDEFTLSQKTITERFKNCDGREEECAISATHSFKEGMTYSYYDPEEGGIMESLSFPGLNMLQAFHLGTVFCAEYKNFKIEYSEYPVQMIRVLRDDVGCDFTILEMGGFCLIKWTAGC